MKRLILIVILLLTSAAYSTAEAENCSCTASDGSCSASNSCAGQCIALCPDGGGCRAVCADDPDAISVTSTPASSGTVAFWSGLIKEHEWLFSATVLAVLLMTLLSTQLISVLLKLDIWGIKQVAPAVYLFAPFGRWKLYRGYRERLRTSAGLSEDLKYGVEHYVDLPYVTDGAPGTKARLSDLFAKLPPERRVVVEADGGRGKSTLCYYLARRCVERRDLFDGKLLEPVVVDGLTYTGDILQAITGALSKDSAYVNKSIVESQVAAGNLLVIFEGFSEIRDTYLAAASSGELPEFVRQYPHTPFIFTSRSSLPPGLQQALTDPLTVRLCDVDEMTERLFLSQYLKRGEEEVDSLIRQVRERFNDLPRIPLMLKLVAAVYDDEGQVPKNTAALFDKYTRQVLRAEATGLRFSGLQYAINHLARETYLRSGGDRGFTENRGIELLRQIKDELEARDIKLSPIGLLDVLTRAGLYKQIGRYLRFFHDSFESYFGARALESDFSDGKYELLNQCIGNERLSETWRFLNEILEDPGDRHKLEMISSTITSASLKGQAEAIRGNTTLPAHTQAHTDNYKPDEMAIEILKQISKGIAYEGELGNVLKFERQQISNSLRLLEQHGYINLHRPENRAPYYLLTTQGIDLLTKSERP